MPHSGFVKAFTKLSSVNPFPQMTWKTCHQFVHVAQDYQGCVLSGFRVQDHFADRLPSEQGQGGMTLLLGPRKGLLGISFPSSHPYDVITTKLQSEFPLPIKAKTCNIWVRNGKHILSSKYDVYLTPPNVICSDFLLHHCNLFINDYLIRREKYFISANELLFTNKEFIFFCLIQKTFCLT